MSDITLPKDVAKRYAVQLRAIAVNDVIGVFARDVLTTMADLLDPPPASLRERVSEALQKADGVVTYLDMADPALAVVAEAVEALPSGGIHSSTPHYRRAVLDLLRGDR